MVFDQTRSPFERKLTRIATLFAGVAAVSYLALGVLLGRVDLVERSVVAFLIVGVGLVARRFHREQAAYVIGAALAGTMGYGLRHPAAGQASTAVALTICLMAMGFFVRSRRILALMGGVVVVYLVTLALGASDRGFQVADAVTTSISVLFGLIMVVALRRDLVARSARHQHLFNEAPVALWEEDFSRVVRALSELHAKGVTDIRGYLDRHRNELSRIVAEIVVVQVNEETLALLEADDRSQLMTPLLVTDDNAASFVDQLAAVWERRASVVTEISDGETLRGRPFSVLLHWSVPVVEGEPDYRRVHVATVDLTTQKDHERRLRELLDARDEFVATISHELRTPLTAVVGLSEELRDRSHEIPEAEKIELTGLVAAQSLEVANIVEDLLVASRVGSDQVVVRRGPVNMSNEVRSVLDTYLGSTPPIAVDVSDDVRLALGDETRVRQILRNLVVNTQRYGGPSVRATISDLGDAIVTEIRDDGKPLPAHQRNAIFQPFFRARQTHGVTASVGLGLTVSRELARLMGGELSYEHDGSETIFSLRLPVLADESIVAREALVY